MKIPIEPLTLDTLRNLKEHNDWNDHFRLVVYPRILFWLGLKKQFEEYASLDWKIHFTPDNMFNNFVSMHVKDPRHVFNFHFQIPLVEKLSFNLFLGDSTYNFFEIHPLLIKMGLIQKDEYQIKATSATIPRLVLSTQNSKYDKSTLWKIDEKNYADIVRHDPLINLLTSSFKKFVPPLVKIIEGDLKL
ncbi:hypothetical protein SAMN06265379_109108 [Saccharicrinis carchari]|uniref:Uncharacterized protein n=1 Tax=Saccharicrinis carchari TaxID=1168039 RepID=A0A521EL76_SACCC|nr:hypothetical protein [Saccharicrinis carchari]SMO84664.1 hypothetical protein SAMN06265379_109108 [Saccharicrinis carchari]